AGSIAISTRALEITGGGMISSKVENSSGMGGSASVRASEQIRIAGAGDERQITRSAIATNVRPTGTGDAGTISLDAPSITIDGGAVVQSLSEGAGRAGEIRVSGRDLTLSGARSQISTETRQNIEGGGDA